jgi:hypothetical protein
MGWLHEAHVNHILNIGSCSLENHGISFTKVSRLMSRKKSMFVLTTKRNTQTDKPGERNVLFNAKVNCAHSYKGLVPR